MAKVVSTRTAKKSLVDKGFVVKSDRDHRYYFHVDRDGKKTGAFVYFSEGGKKADEIGPSLLRRMTRQLQLERIHEVFDLLTCPMDKEAYSTRRYEVSQGSD